MAAVLLGDKPYVIPPRPEALIKISQLLKQPEPDVDQIVAALKADVSLYTAVLGAANMPIFGRGGKVTSLNQAVMRLGFKRLYTMISIDALKSVLSRTGRLERFWDSATEVAALTASLAAKYTREDRDEAYALGMLHDCGIPLMMEAFPDYRSFLKDIRGNDLAALYSQEMKRYGHNHFALSTEIAAGWFMPTAVCEALALQTDYASALQDKSVGSEAGKYLLCCLLLAKDISETYRHYWRINNPRTECQNLKPVLEYLGIPDVDYLDIREDYVATLEQIQ